MKEAGNVVTSPAAAPAPGKAVKVKGRPRGPATDWGAGASAAAKRLAAAILEVLAGTRTPAEAAQAVGVSLPSSTGGKRRRRRPTARALPAAARLQTETAEPPPAASVENGAV